jgi:hypothetical protein
LGFVLQVAVETPGGSTAVRIGAKQLLQEDTLCWIPCPQQPGDWMRANRTPLAEHERSTRLRAEDVRNAA